MCGLTSIYRPWHCQKSPRPPIDCFVLPRCFIQHIPSPFIMMPWEGRAGTKFSPVNAACFLRFALCFFCLFVCFLQRPSNLTTLCYSKLMTEMKNRDKKRDLQDSMHCCGSNPRSMLMNCTCDNQHLSHAIITLTKPRSIYLWWKIYSPKNVYTLWAPGTLEAESLCITEPQEANTSICGWE